MVTSERVSTFSSSCHGLPGKHQGPHAHGWGEGFWRPYPRHTLDIPWTYLFHCRVWPAMRSPVPSKEMLLCLLSALLPPMNSMTSWAGGWACGPLHQIPLVLTRGTLHEGRQGGKMKEHSPQTWDMPGLLRAACRRLTSAHTRVTNQFRKKCVAVAGVWTKAEVETSKSDPRKGLGDSPQPC